jgi:hypothetical protein
MTSVIEKYGGVRSADMSEVPMQFSTEDQRKRLVQDVADALATYFGDRQGDFGCHILAVKMLIKAGPLRGHAAGDFFVAKGAAGRRPAKGLKIG